VLRLYCSPVELRTLAHTDLSVSRCCLGTLAFGSSADEPASLKMVDMALDAGINFFDTANVYSDGRSEEILGRALKSRRSEVVVATKVRSRFGDGPDEGGLSRAAIRRALDASLQRLGMDYVDIYYLHQPDYDVPIEETLEAMDEAVRAGKIRYPASSNYSSWQVCEMLWIADKNGWKPPTITQPMYNLLARGADDEYLPMAEHFGVSTVAYGPLAGGMLTGKHRRDAPVPGSRFDSTHRLAGQYHDRYWNDAVFAAVDELRTLAQAHGRTPAALALSWILHHSPIDCMIVGSSRPEELAENLAAAESGPLPAEVVAACDRIHDQLRGVIPKYNR
jgi:aryl-alcohol dehydrogenase-like predicted oxidoreductase